MTRTCDKSIRNFIMFMAIVQYLVQQNRGQYNYMQRYSLCFLVMLIPSKKYVFTIFHLANVISPAATSSFLFLISLTSLFYVYQLIFKAHISFQCDIKII